jgi:outer membrane protein OmpA-like peptidoglycan-associated protein
MKKGIIFILMLTVFFYGTAQSTGKYQIKFLEVNKKNSDYGVAILDNNKLVFTSAEEKANNAKKNYNPRKDLFVGDIDFDGEIKNIKPVISKIDYKYNQTGVTYTKDNKTVYFSRNKYVKKLSKQNLAKNKRLELFRADVNADGSWENIEKLPFNKKLISTGYPVLNSDNTKLYFVSNRQPSQGKSDIFVVDILKNGKFSKPKNLGRNVNTSGNETTPFITEANILYFSSDGHPGKGKLDVFAVEVYDKTTSEIYQLAAPINSINDDFAYIVNKDNNQGFFTSNRLQGEGFNDLYSFTLEEDVRPGECFITVDGKVRDKDSKEVISGATVDLYNLKGNLLESVSTFDDGTYKFTVSCAKEYKLIASSDNYNNDEKRIEILEENYHSALHTNLVLSKIHKDKPVIERLQPIYYEFDDATITEAAAKEMDRIVIIMKDNTDLVIEASAFTDSRGSDSYNIILSQKRAKAAVEYLRSQGVDMNRIKSKGYGENKLINQCVNGVDCTEEAHQMNRRTEFNFVNIQANIKSKEPDKKKSRLVYHTNKPREQVMEKPKIKADPIQYKKEKPKIANVENQKTVIEQPKKENKESDNIATTNKITEKKQEEKVVNDKESVATAPEKKENSESKKVVNENIANVNVSQKTKIIKDKKDVKEERSIAKAEQENSKPVKKEVQEELIVNYNSSIVATNKKSNKALNYIANEKIKVIDKLTALEKKFELAIPEYTKVSDSLRVEKNKITEIIQSAKEMEETGWSNIIEYKNNLLAFNKKYYQLISKDIRRNRTPITQIRSIKHNANLNNEGLSSTDLEDKEILEENLRVTSIDVIAMKMNSSGKYQKTNNANKTELIKVSFKLLHNDKVKPGKKEAHIILQNPEGKVAQAKGIFKIKNSETEKKYTDHTIIDYNKNDINVTMFIQRKGDNFEKGIYPVKLFVEGELMAVSNLNLQDSF